MTNEMIEAKVNEAVELSDVYGRAWLLSNGKELMVTRREVEKDILTDENREYGFWVAAIYENGHPVEA